MSNPSHIDRLNSYVDGVVSGEVVACKHVANACRRHRRDVEKSKLGDYPFRFDEVKAERVCKFVSMLPHVKGKWARKDERGRQPSITLEPWQCFVVGSIFGWVKKRNGMRRFNRASIYVPRKNAKSTLAAGIGWWMFAKDDEPGAEVYSGATSEKQAWEVFGPARMMAKKMPALASQLGITVNASSMVSENTGSRFVPVIGKPGDGASPHLAIVDEYHEHPDSSLYDTMKTGMGAREQPLLLIISTAGENISGPCKDDWDELAKVLDGTIEDESFFGIIYSLDEGDDWATEAALAKANPNLGVSVNPEIYLPDMSAAVRDPKKQGIFQTKHLNKWVTALNGWINMESWRKCEQAVSIDNFRGQRCWVGLDAASKIDLTALIIVFDRPGIGPAVFGKYFIPEETARLPQNAHYRGWIAAGQMVATPGARVDFTVIEDQLKEWEKQFTIEALCYDPRELNDFINRVGVWASFALIEVVQSAALMSEPMKELEAQVEVATLAHDGDPVLAWMASNVVRKEARGGGPVKYYYPTKTKPGNKIDGMVALIMAIARWMAGRVAKKKSVYESRGIRTL